MSEQQGQRKPAAYARYANLLIGIILALFLIIFGSQSLTQGLIGAVLALVSYAAAVVLIYVTILNYYRVGYAVSHMPEKTYTVYKCPTCGYQLTKDFAYGDYVGRPGDPCPKDGTTMLVEKIYTTAA